VLLNGLLLISNDATASHSSTRPETVELSSIVQSVSGTFQRHTEAVLVLEAVVRGQAEQSCPCVRIGQRL